MGHASCHSCEYKGECKNVKLGLQIGDKVKVLEPDKHANNWDDNYDDFIGEIGTIQSSGHNDETFCDEKSWKVRFSDTETGYFCRCELELQ